MKISAAELVKRSATQLLYKEVKKVQRNATPRQIKGNTYADEVVLKEQASSEKRGIVQIKDDLLFFCIDMVKDNKLIEIKMVDNEENYEDWYLYSSIIQSTFYATLSTKVNYLDTPKFRKKEGFKQEVIDVPKDFTFELWFGNTQKYEVYPNEAVYNHYLNKIKVIKECLDKSNWNKCREFDKQFKFKEFSIYKPTYLQINN